ncbi:MAG: hypothetical protein ACOCXI_09875 [Chloroflexota bacterium]
MSLTANFDYCIQLGIAQVREIFHLAFKSEDRYPHNVGPITRTFSGREMIINVRVLDDEDRAADLTFQDEKHMLFSFPFDLTAEVADAPDPALSRVTLQVRVEVPGKLHTWVETQEVLGISFFDITADDVNIVTLDGLPTINIDNFLAAIHNKYEDIPHVYTDGSGGELILYDGNRDTTLIPPNSSGQEIGAVLEEHSGQEYLKISAPIHVTVPLPSGGIYTSYGEVVFWREVQRSDTIISVNMGVEPAEAALRTQVELDDVAGQRAAEEVEIESQLHAAYEAEIIPHSSSQGFATLQIYDGDRDPELEPPYEGNPEIEGALETHNGDEYLHVTLPIYLTASLYAGFGDIQFWRPVTRTATTLTVNMSTVPTDSDLATQVNLGGIGGSTAAAAVLPFADPMVNAFGSISGPSFGAATAALTGLVIEGINSFGTITEPAFSEAAARQLLQEEIASYLGERRYPFYSPESGDPDEPLSTPVGFLLVADEVLAILVNRRSGTAADDHAPDNFLGGNDMALAVGRAKVDEVIGEAVVAEFPGLSPDNGCHTGSEELETDEGDATLQKVCVAPSDPDTHGESEGHLWVTGEAEVHIDCWPDPDISFSGPIFLRATPFEEDGQCGLEIEAVAGDFDVDQSCCDVLLDLLIIVVGWIMLVIIENMIDEVGGELAKDIAAGQAENIEPFPPVVNGIAEVHGCLTGLNVSSEGFVLPGELTIRRLGTSYEDLESDSDLPRP